MIQSKSENVSLLVVEEQEIYREIYNNVLTKNANIDVLRISGTGEKGSMIRAVAELSPDVMLLSIKKLDTDTIEELEKIRNSYPKIGIVILIVYYSSKDIELLRRLALCGESGMALKPGIDCFLGFLGREKARRKRGVGKNRGYHDKRY